MDRSSSPLSSIPSSPLTDLSRSPTPPSSPYPSPPSSHASDAGNSQIRQTEGNHEDAPPAKRQKITKSKDGKTEYLNLQALHDSDDESHHQNQDPKLKRLLDALRTKKKIVVIAGAGISVSAGIPDFRSSTGLFKNLRTQHNLKASGKQLFDADVYRNDLSTTNFHAMVRQLSHATRTAKPTPFHHMLATLAKEGRLLRLYTQNLDGIDTGLEPLATTVPLHPKGPWPKTIQLHGGLEKMVCSKCGQLSVFDGSLFEGPEPPSCKECMDVDAVRVAAGLRSHGIGRLRPRLVLYNEYNPDEDAIGNVSHADLKSRPDAVIVVGTTLKVPGIRRLARELCSVARDKRGGFTAWINCDPEPIGIDLKDCWDMVVRGKCDDVARHVNLPHWNDEGCEDFQMIHGEESENRGDFDVVVDSKPLLGFKTQGIPTPVDSPRQQSPTPTAVKLKQSSLSFGSAKPALNKNGKIKKKSGRKPLPSKPIALSEKITTVFGASKASDSSVKKKVSSKLGKEQPPGPGLSEGTSSGQAKTTKISVSPSHDPTNSPPTTQGCQTPKSVHMKVEVPHYNRQETISPKGGIPSGMKDLLS